MSDSSRDIIDRRIWKLSFGIAIVVVAFRLDLADPHWWDLAQVAIEVPVFAVMIHLLINFVELTLMELETWIDRMTHRRSQTKWPHFGPKPLVRRSTQRTGSLQLLVGLKGFEPSTFRPPAGRATKLRHSPL